MDIDLSGMPLVDQHCHGIWRAPATDPERWRAFFSESSDPRMCGDAVASTVYYLRLVREMAAAFRCEPTESAVLAERERLGPERVLDLLWGGAGIASLVIDTGFPPEGGDRLVAEARLAEAGRLSVARVLRIELVMQERIAAHASLDDVIDAVRQVVASLREDGYVGLKSVVAYRTGLDIHDWPSSEAEASLRQAREEVLRHGRVRLAHKPLLDTLLLAVLEEAGRREIPVQFHTGYGDTDADVRLANPLHLRWILENPALRRVPIVLLHEAYPFTREAAVLSGQYGNVYLDLDYGIPFLGHSELLAMTRAALAVAPTARLVYSSDGAAVPEIHWSAARWGRRLLGRALGELVEAGECDVPQAEGIGRAILQENARVLYGL